MTSVDSVGAVLARIADLPSDWHGRGSVANACLVALAHHAGNVGTSMETGTGATTLLLSHLSQDHSVFTIDDSAWGKSLEAVQSSELLQRERVTFVLGPTQRTLLNHAFPGELDVACLDGPHAYPFPELEYWAVYPHVRTGGLLVVDDIHIPTIGNMFRVLRRDEMWELVDVVETMAFFRRTAAPALDPFGEGWWLQGYNHKTRHPMFRHTSQQWFREHTPAQLRAVVRRIIGR
ncbi:MAG: class I SAM-dependent methyltransferase [Actinomycetota bacterium]|nr:class I SAM-dependent methyltransferase [Actinomycetota bacterium]